MSAERFDNDAMSSAVIDHLIFHVIEKAGAGEITFVDEIDWQMHSQFFIDLLATAARGPELVFLGTGITRSTLENFNPSDATKSFAQVAKQLVTEFQALYAQDGRFAKGVFIVLRGSIGKKPFWSLLKYDDIEGMGITTSKKNGRTIAELNELGSNLSPTRDALQKAAIFGPTKKDEVLRVYDRSNKAEITSYFRSFLGAKLRKDSKQSSTDLLRAVRETARETGLDVGEAVKKLAAVANTGLDIDLSNVPKSAARFFGDNGKDEKVQNTLKRKLKSAQLDDTMVKPDRRVLRAQRIVQVKSEENVDLRYPQSLEDDGKVTKSQNGDTTTYTFMLTRPRKSMLGD